jgi:aminopeptidase N
LARGKLAVATKRGHALTGGIASTDSYLPAHGNGGYRVSHYDLELDYRPGPGRLAGRATITAVAESSLDGFSLDLGPFRIDRVAVDGKPVRYTHRAGKLRVRPARPLRAGAPFTVEVRYIGTPKPLRSHWGEIGWEQLTDGALVASQPIGAPSWFPCNDHVADKASYRISVTTPSPYTVLANGILVSRKVGAGSTTWVYSQAEPMASYLATVQIGRYELLEVGYGQTAAVPARLAGAFTHDFGRQPEMLAAFEESFGPYPFEMYSVVVVDEELEVPVEAQGLSTFGANHVDGARGAENLVAHELAHQWFGNSLTVADWRHIWLNEGFSTYAEWLWSESSGGSPASVLATRAWSGLSRLPQDLVLADPGVRRMFDDRVYQRGALTLQALRTTIGDPAFFPLLREWTSTQRHGTVTTEQFTALAARRSPAPLDTLFTSWLYDTRLPNTP